MRGLGLVSFFFDPVRLSTFFNFSPEVCAYQLLKAEGIESIIAAYK